MQVLDDPMFREGFGCLASRGLTFETWLFHLQLPALTRLATDFPDQVIICDHVAMPLGISSFASKRGWEGAVATEWRAGIKALAKCPNVYCKLGGLTQPHAGFEFNTKVCTHTHTHTHRHTHTLTHALTHCRCVFAAYPRPSRLPARSWLRQSGRTIRS